MDNNYSNIDELISKQNNKLESLKRAISIIGDQKHLKIEFQNIFNLINNIKSNMNILQNEFETTKGFLQSFENCAAEYEHIQEVMLCMGKNISSNDNLPYSLDMCELEAMTLNETISNTLQPNIRRHLDFVDDSVCNSAKKDTAKNSTMRHMSLTEYESIPNYMRGRVTYEAINSFIDKINLCLNEKYKLLSISKANLKKRSDIEKFMYFKRQECDQTKGKRFFVIEDLKTVCTVDKAVYNLLTMLRHTQHIKEIRIGKIIKYVNNHY